MNEILDWILSIMGTFMVLGAIFLIYVGIHKAGLSNFTGMVSFITGLLILAIFMILLIFIIIKIMWR